MKFNSEFEIVSEHICNQILTMYNYCGRVGVCVFCGFDTIEDQSHKHKSYVIGFNKPPFRSGIVKHVAALVWRCPKCNKVQWYHCGSREYREYKRYEKKDELYWRD